MALTDQFNAWADQLVDLSGRNDLISFRPTKTSTLELTPEMASQLETGQWCELRDLFDFSQRTTKTLLRRVLGIAEDNADQLGIETLTFISGFAQWSAERISRPQAPFLLTDIEVRGSATSPERCALRLALDSATVNPVFLQYLRSQTAFSLAEETIEEALDTGVDAAQALLRQQSPPELQLQFTSGLFIKNLSYQKLPMVEDLRRATDALSRHPVIAALAGDQVSKQILQEQTVECSRSTPNRTPSSEEFLILDSDASQQWAINTALEGHNLVVEGPPGTGKSQTIANLIGACMARGKSVLFVAEKRAAIDAVKKRIDRVGLGELMLDLHDASILKARPAQPFAQALEALAEIPAVDLNPIHQPLDQAKQRLLDHSSALHERHLPWESSYYDVGSLLVSNRVAELPIARLQPDELQSIGRADLDQLCALIIELGTLPAAAALDPNWLFAPAIRNGSLADSLAVESLLERSDALETSIQKLQTWLALAMPLLRQTEGLRLVDAAEIAGKVQRLFGELVREVDLGRILALAPDQRRQLGSQLAKGLKQNLLASLFDSSHKNALAQAATLSQSSNLSPIPEALALVEQLGETLKRLEAIPGSDSLPSAVSAIREHLGWLQQLGVTVPPDYEPLQHQLEALNSATKSRRLLIQAAPVVQRLAAMEQRGASRSGLIDFIAQQFSSGTTSDNLCQSLRYGWASQVEEKIALKVPLLSEASRANLDALVERFRSNDRQAIEATPLKVRRLVAERAHSIRLTQEGQSQERLIRGEALKARRKGRLTARRLFEAAPELLTALKPCWAMSPLVVSQLLPSNQQHFDLVIFDEASQIVPYEAVTAILRGKQVVVAGDSKQLSPTSTAFFSSRLDEDDIDTSELDDSNDYEVDAVKEAESLLEAMKACLPPMSGTRMLQWHYRSEDERLIAFSNAHPDLYDSKLITLPGAAATSPFAYHLVHGSQADVSGASPNAEVQRTVELAIDHLQQSPEQSLAVVAFGLKHAMRIQKAFEMAIDELGAEVQLHPKDRPEEKFRIRNLETIQGDERDVVIIATGYGLTSTGKPSYAFGPLNNDENLQGLRRLNVAITRARKRVVVVSTINPDLYDANRLTKIGSKAFIDYLRFCRSGGNDLGELAVERPALNPFEQDIHDALQAQGLNLVSQHGVSGYRLDFAVQHPEEPGRFVLAIEADGASYHSSDTARDRDRIRQDHLEKLGWRFHRIWSTEWIHNRDQEVAAAVSAYEKALKASTSNSPQIERNGHAREAFPALITANRERGARPPIPHKDTITDFSDAELQAMVLWWQSDQILRSDDEIISALLPELGYKRKGPRIVKRLESAIQNCRSQRLVP